MKIRARCYLCKEAGVLNFVYQDNDDEMFLFCSNQHLKQFESEMKGEFKMDCELISGRDYKTPEVLLIDVIP